MPGARITSGERVTLRTVEREDVPFLQRGTANPELRYPLGSRLLNQQQVEEIILDDSEDQFLVCLDGDDETSAASRTDDDSVATAAPDDPDEGDSYEDDSYEDDSYEGDSDEDDVRPIGVVFVKSADWRRPELVYWLVPEVHGEGYGKEAVSLVVDYVFRTYDHPAVGAGAYEFNDASRGLLESLGFEEEGRIRKDRFVDGEYVDSVKYGLLRRKWREQREA